MFDPLGFCSKADVTKEKIDFYRDAEMKHGRLGMLASVGILAAEHSHPIGGKAFDGVPAFSVEAGGFFGQGPFVGFWTTLFLLAGVLESQSMRGDKDGRRGWDPLNFSKDAATLAENRNTELAFGRIGMIGAIGMIAQEMSTGAPILS